MSEKLSREEAARQLGIELGSRLVDYARSEQRSFVRKFGHPMPIRDVVLGAAEYLRRAAERMPTQGSADQADDGSNGR